MKTRIRPLVSTLALGLIAASNGCAVEPQADDVELGKTSQAIASVMGGIDSTVDAPWRLEPLPSGGYSAIPIVVSIHDADNQTDPEHTINVGRVCDAIVEEEGVPGSVTIPPSSFYEVESSGRWYPTDEPAAANHRLCRRWAGEDCSSQLDLRGKAEWHGTFLYTPSTARPGKDVRLKVRMRVANGDIPCSDPTMAVQYAFPVGMHQPKDDSTRRRPYVFDSRLWVHAGDAPLPRFGTNWAYGDLHYHSQGTDNEGESGVAYRPVLQAMKAMGLDFAFATDHASDSAQITNMQEIYVDIPQTGIRTVDWLISGMAGKIAIGVHPTVGALRDMSDQRWTYLHGWLNGPTGANKQIADSWRPRVPQLFLGGEVDVVPELSASEATTAVAYGNKKQFHWEKTCDEVPSDIKSLWNHTSLEQCTTAELLDPMPDGRFLVKDVQGVGELFYGRQHMLSLPRDPARKDAFVSSETSIYGGGKRRLKNVLATEFSGPTSKGYTFLAHPVEAAGGSGLGRLGPDIMPYSNSQLKIAFDSEAVLGLEFWNEDSRLASGNVTDPMLIQASFPIWSSHDDFPLPAGMSPEFTNTWMKVLGFEPGVGSAPPKARPDIYGALHDGAATWDRMLLWGLDPAKTTGLTWLPRGQPRRVFMAGGSDAHGDLNFRREGRATGFMTGVDTALGKPRNLVDVGQPSNTVGTSKAFGQTQVVDALRRGNFSVTDGPALRIAIDMNGNGVIDDADLPMGSVGTFDLDGQLPVVVEWKSTPEFGPVNSVDLYVGGFGGGKQATYAPMQHGVRDAKNPSGNAGNDWLDASGGHHVELEDGYMKDTTGKLHIDLASTPGVVGNGMEGRLKLTLDMDDYKLGDRKVTYIPGCVVNPKTQEDTCTDNVDYSFVDPRRPDSVYVRAFAKTTPRGGSLCSTYSSDASKLAWLRGDCIERLAYANPVWAKQWTLKSFSPIISGPLLTAP